MANPIINLEKDVYYFGCTDDVDTRLIVYQPGVQLSYNLDRLLDQIHPHEDDTIMAPVTGFEVPEVKDLKHSYVFMQPVLEEGLFFGRDSFVRIPVGLRRARLIQKWNYKNMYTTKGKTK